MEVFEELLDAVVAIQPDHSICTGDLVNLALAPEFEKFNPYYNALGEELTLNACQTMIITLKKQA